MGIQINGQTDTVTSTTSGGSVTVTPANFPSVSNLNATGIVTTTRLNVGTGGTIVSTTTGGSIGIGTTNPGGKIHIRTSTGSDIAGGSDSHIIFDLADDGGPAWAQRLYKGTAGGGGASDGSFALDKRSGGVWTNVLTATRDNGYIGIGTALPAQKLEVVGGEIKAGRVDSTNEGGQVTFGRSTDNASAWYIDVYGNTSTPQLRFVDVSTASVRMSIDGSGRITAPYQPRAHITKTGGTTLTTSATKITFDAATYDIGSNYSDANDRYTAPVAGYYFVSSNVNVINTTNNVTISVYKNGAVYGNMRSSTVAANVRFNYTISAVVYLAAGDYIEVFGILNTGTVSVDNDGFLSIALLG